MEEKKVRVRTVQTGMALEVDVLKKLAHQLGRLPTAAAKRRAADYVMQAATEGSPRATIPAPPPEASDEF